jgi:hypothetical protein
MATQESKLKGRKFGRRPEHLAQNVVELAGMLVTLEGKVDLLTQRLGRLETQGRDEA